VVRDVDAPATRRHDPIVASEKRSFSQAAVGTAIATVIMIPFALVCLPLLFGLAPFAIVFFAGGLLYMETAALVRALGRRAGAGWPRASD
jgi:hypothetical protein